MVRRFVNWVEFDHLLGTVADEEVARLAGCTRNNVSRRRKSLAINPKFKTHLTASEKAEDLERDAQGLRRCCRCSEVKPVEKFGLSSRGNKNGLGGYQRWCKTCRSIYQAQRFNEVRDYWRLESGNCCQNCGWNQWPVCLDYHHIDGDDKSWSPGKLIICHQIGSPVVRAELDKCALLCSNCHQAIHRGGLRLNFVKRVGLGWTVSK